MRILIAGLLCILCSAAFAQSTPVYQSATTVAPNSVPYWLFNGIIGGGVTANDSPITGFGITSNNFNSFCISSQRASVLNRQQLCFGVTDSGGANIYVQNYGGDSPLPLTFTFNGTAITPANCSGAPSGSFTVINGIVTHC